ncbi:Hypothetical protein, putative [Bodo saltans]|uniref:RING-type domain-containing protein n=1 Tax=Bodo saltans TaxID=75058 RepID=A0A0S4JJP6_BODSA|nr:Hypothetical protein, putative [Bodo saltans]|eukprot:CUG90488.1 Hypothetical protein, putative [Bodo saltans]
MSSSPTDHAHVIQAHLDPSLDDSSRAVDYSLFEFVPSPVPLVDAQGGEDPAAAATPLALQTASHTQQSIEPSKQLSSVMHLRTRGRGHMAPTLTLPRSPLSDAAAPVSPWTPLLSSPMPAPGGGLHPFLLPPAAALRRSDASGMPPSRSPQAVRVTPAANTLFIRSGNDDWNHEPPILSAFQQPSHHVFHHSSYSPGPQPLRHPQFLFHHNPHSASMHALGPQGWSGSCNICCAPQPLHSIYTCSNEQHKTCSGCLGSYILSNWRGNELRCCQPGCTSRALTTQEVVQYVTSKAAMVAYIDRMVHQTAALCFGEAHAIVMQDAPEATVVAEKLQQKQLQKSMHAARMCPHCKAGPIDFFGCENLAQHHGEERNGVRTNNSCQRCGFFASHIDAWARWDGVVRNSDEPVERWLGTTAPSPQTRPMHSATLTGTRLTRGAARTQHSTAAPRVDAFQFMTPPLSDAFQLMTPPLSDSFQFMTPRRFGRDIPTQSDSVGSPSPIPRNVTATNRVPPSLSVEREDQQSLEIGRDTGSPTLAQQLLTTADSVQRGSSQLVHQLLPDVDVRTIERHCMMAIRARRLRGAITDDLNLDSSAVAEEVVNAILEG